MKIGLDYWQVCSHYPDYFRELARAHLAMNGEVHIVSAIGQGRSGTIAAEVAELGIPSSGVHEVVFRHPKESPQLKLAKCVELGIQVFYDDREDVCRLLNQHGILALHVPRRNPSAGDLSAGDLSAERDAAPTVT
jgi:hypothetical protein